MNGTGNARGDLDYVDFLTAQSRCFDRRVIGDEARQARIMGGQSEAVSSAQAETQSDDSFKPELS